MAPATTGGSSSVPSLPPPCPKSPPEYPDLYGKRREMAKVQMLEREIGFLEEELKSLHGLQPASRCCKEVTDFVVANSDPLIPTSRKKRRSCLFWKWLCGIRCFNLSWICCCCSSGCSLHLECPSCYPIAVERSHATGTAAAALVNCLHAQIAHVAGGHALVPNAQSQRFVVCLLKLAAMCQGICSLFTSNTALVQELVNL
ncbi:hypothetical protein NC652_016703 [Populus alba x Populus x berolinensis]|uniref:G protein gamma domain-containing protein n=2 Tax=Populus TaxID=3689 RepID=A0A4U5QRL9_POPAL|nr:hypothetical protein NC652_016703 [Populus alba x Populus x berolinensis]KAJ6993557.1 hypothetical protein NC653_016634 [Populus alba x Populus x berolinensis]TKS13039.1 hypothetical protein D5086_0000053520 [Populus alba]